MLEKMKEIIAEQLGVSIGELGLDTSFKDDLDADSLDLFELIMALEDEYDIEIPAEESAKLKTLGDVVEYLKDQGIED
ncbi:MAG: acyl carrier protein [Lachnospiraceae bacterium]|nr:acyl carrier protein [Lachnospiraceae bacterium]